MMMNNLLRDEYSYFNDMAYDDVDNDELMFHVEESTSAAADDVVSMASVLTDGATMNETSVLEQFSHWYQGVHGYVCVVCCMFGIVSNAMNILVLTRRSMTSPTNHLLTAVAIADLLTMVSYLPYAVYFYCITVPDEMYGHPIGWVIYLMFNTYFTITTHTAAMWLTVALAVFRYLVVCCKQSVGANLCSLRRAKITIAAVFVATPIFCIPHYVKYVIVSRTPTNTSTQDNSDVNLVTDGDLERPNVDHYVSISPPPSVQVDMGYWFTDAKIYNETMTTVNYWLFGVVLKVVPCVLLAVLSWLLVRAMREAADKRRRLLSAGRRDESERAGEHVRTTAMLVAVVLCFLATELPQGVLALLSSVVPGVFDNVYVPLADIFDVLVLVNSAVNFVLYCSMSRQFRRTFGELFIDTTCVGRKKKASNSQAAITSSGLTRATTLTAKDEGTPVRR